MKRTMISAALICGILFFASLLLQLFFPADLLFTLAITFGITFYHLAIRLLIGGIVKCSGSFLQPDHWWFQEKPLEKKLYKLLRIHKLKGHLPTFSPEEFDISLGIDHVIASTLRAEVVHELDVIVSFVPLLMNFYAPSSAYLITSILAAVFDLMFVILQRYNRPRLMKLKNRRPRRSSRNA